MKTLKTKRVATMIISKPYKFDDSKQYPAVMYANSLWVEVDRNSRTVELVSARDTTLLICVDTKSEDTPLGFTRKIPGGTMEYLLKPLKGKENAFRGFSESHRFAN